MLPITRWPCMLISGQRSGSTALAINLAKHFNTRCFIEPNEQYYKLDEFNGTFTDFSNPYILKVMVDRVKTSTTYRYLLDHDDVFKIRLYRENTIAQVASMYVATITENWFNNQLYGLYVSSNRVNDNIGLPIDDNIILKCARMAIRNNNILQTNICKFDLSVCYEALNMNEDLWRKSSAPINYATIISAVTRVMIKNRYPLSNKME